MFNRGINKYRYKRRDLPHWDIPGQRQALTYRLWDSIPQSEVRRIEKIASNVKWDMKDYTLRRLTEECLHHGYGCGLLKYPEIAKIVLQSWLEFEGKAYDLYEWVIMPNHVHLLFRPYPGYSLPDIVKSWKSNSSPIIRQSDVYRQATQNYPDDLKQSVWNIDFFDRSIRSNSHFANVKKYIHNNPVGLQWNGKTIEKPEDWAFSSASNLWKEFF